MDRSSTLDRRRSGPVRLGVSPLALLVCATVFACNARQKRPQPPPLEPETALTLEALSEQCSVASPLTPGIPGSPGNPLPSEINPNGDSELSALMRAMQSDLRAARDAVLRGKAPQPMLERHARIRCTWPTNPDIRTGEFDALAQSYLLAIENLQTAEPADRKDAYAAVVNDCVTCHRSNCPGPIVAIEALRLPEAP